MNRSVGPETALLPGETGAPDASAWAAALRADPYRSYLYAYPHKTAYRPFAEPLSIAELWRDEPAETFFLYMHIPFCGARCGFCNLFTLPDKGGDAHEGYVDALERQARQWAEAIGRKPLARFAIGGGTPTLLAPKLLGRLFDIAEETMGLDPRLASISVETSPETATPERLRLLRERRVDRISMGIQTFVEAEAAAVYRPQKPIEAQHVAERLKLAGFPIVNLDLIYGLPGQTVDSWLYSLEVALAFEPEELFIYPLYTREHTIVKPGDVRRAGDDIRMECYLAARDRLRAAGYEQSSMRRFARPAANAGAGADKSLLPYGCQEEGMIGLGCGARSYTREVHYSSRYAVARSGTASIIADYVAAASYATADYGIRLTAAEQQRRFIVKGLLHAEGLDRGAYEQRFGRRPEDDHPELERLAAVGFAAYDGTILRLTDEGMALSDAIGDVLISPEIRQLMTEFEFL